MYLYIYIYALKDPGGQQRRAVVTLLYQGVVSEIGEIGLPYFLRNMQQNSHISPTIRTTNIVGDGVRCTPGFGANRTPSAME